MFFRLAYPSERFRGFVLISILATSPSVNKIEGLCLFLLTEVRGYRESSVLTVDQFLNIGVVQQQDQSFDFNGESDLDLEYAMSLTDPTPVTLLQTGDLVEGLDLRSRDEYLLLISPLNLQELGLITGWTPSINSTAHSKAATIPMK